MGTGELSGKPIKMTFCCCLFCFCVVIVVFVVVVFFWGGGERELPLMDKHPFNRKDKLQQSGVNKTILKPFLP